MLFLDKEKFTYISQCETFSKVDQNKRDNWLIHGTKYGMKNQFRSLERARKHS